MGLLLVRVFVVASILSGLAACATSPPASADNICSIFEEKSGWYKASKKAADKWAGNIYVPMSIMYQESSFQAKAKPPIRWFAGFIPYGRPSNAYGYAQALDGTWAEYKRDTGSRFRSRSDFADAMDFIQWYMQKTAAKNRILKGDAYRHYLNYHEGQGGYARGTYNKKPWLIKVARKVEQRAQRYKAQLQQCSARLERKRKWLF
jgi:hypothetical protein